MKDRVDDQLGCYERAANKAKKIHIWMQSLIILFGLLVPIVANLDKSLFLDGEASKTLTITVLSLLLASLTAIANFRKHGDLWLAYRTTEELLKKERFLFTTGSGRYEQNDSKFHDFVERIESIISVEHERFRSVIESAQRPATGQGSGGPSAT